MGILTKILLIIMAFGFVGTSYGQAVNHSPEMQKLQIESQWTSKIRMAERRNAAVQLKANIIADFRKQCACPVVWNLADDSLLADDSREMIWKLADLYWLYLFHDDRQYAFIELKPCSLLSRGVVRPSARHKGERGLRFCFPWKVWGWDYVALSMDQQLQLQEYFGWEHEK